MKTIILLFLIGFSLSYNTGAAIRYARQYCDHYNPKIPYYAYEHDDSASFVSQCMTAGGINFHNCSVGKIDSYGLITRVRDLKLCLQQKGWKHSSTRPASFKPGYPIFSINYEHAKIATAIEGPGVRYCSHTNDRCDAYISSGIEYYFE